MYLYDNDGEFVYVYELVPKVEKIKEYKRKEIEKISEDKRIWTSVASSIDNQIFNFQQMTNVSALSGLSWS